MGTLAVYMYIYIVMKHCVTVIIGQLKSTSTTVGLNKTAHGIQWEQKSAL